MGVKSVIIIIIFIIIQVCDGFGFIIQLQFQ